METISRAVATFLVNALWEVPLMAVAAVLAARMVRSLPARYIYGLWLATLGLSVGLPIASLRVTLDAASANATQALRSPNLSAAHNTLAPIEASGSRGTAVIPAGTLPTSTVGPKVKAGAHRAPLRLPALPISGAVARFVAFGFFLILFPRVKRLAQAWKRTIAIRRGARHARLPAGAAECMDRLRRAFNSSGIPVLLSKQVSSPLTLGARKPVIVLPEGFAERANSLEFAATLAHEMAHVERRDYLFNLMAELVFVPISFHPAAEWIRRRIRKSREFAADELAASRLGQASDYARSLVAIAERLAARPATPLPNYALGLFDTDQLEGRVMRLLDSGARARGRMAKAMLVGGSLVLGTAFVMAARFPMSVVQTSGAASTSSFEPFIGTWRLIVPGKGETELELGLRDGKLTGTVTAYGFGEDEQGVSHEAGRVKSHEWQVTGGRVEKETLDLSGRDDEGTSREFRIHLLNAKVAEFRVVGAPPPPVDIGEEAPRPILMKVESASAHAFAGTWSAKFEGRVYMVVSLAANGDTVGGSVSLGNFGIDIDGQVNHVQDEPNPDYAEPIVSSRLEGDTLTIEAKTRKGGTNSFQMKLVETEQAQIKWTPAAHEPAAPQPGWWTISRMPDKSENEVMPGGPANGVIGGVRGAEIGGVPGGAVGGVPGPSRRIKGMVTGTVSGSISSPDGQGGEEGTVSGTVEDPSGGRLVNAVVSLLGEAAGSKRTTATNEKGEFLIDRVEAGSYRLVVQYPNFELSQGLLKVARSETKTVVNVVMSPRGMMEWVSVKARRPAGVAESPAGKEEKPIREGGELRAGRPIIKTEPIYPENSKRKGIQGDVVLEAVISTEGVPLSVKVIRSPDPDLADAAVAAVKQWRYQPTKLNGEPVEVVTDITVKFTLEN